MLHACELARTDIIYCHTQAFTLLTLTVTENLPQTSTSFIGVYLLICNITSCISLLVAVLILNIDSRGHRNNSPAATPIPPKLRRLLHCMSIVSCTRKQGKLVRIRNHDSSEKSAPEETQLNSNGEAPRYVYAALFVRFLKRPDMVRLKNAHR